MEREFEDMIMSIVNIRRKSFEGFDGRCTLEPEEILRSLINLADINDINLNTSLMPVAMKILRKVIEMENQVR